MCSRVRVDKHLFDMFCIKNGLIQGDGLFNFALAYAIRIVPVNQDGLKLSGTHQHLFYADNILGQKHRYCKEKHRSFSSC